MFASLVTLVIGDNCNSDGGGFVLNQPMAQLRLIRIGKNCFNHNLEHNNFLVDNQPSLRSLCIGNGSFKTFTNFRVNNCPNLSEIIIGSVPTEENNRFVKAGDIANCFQYSSHFDLQSMLCNCLYCRYSIIRETNSWSRLFPGSY